MTICQLDHGETVLYSFDRIWFDKMTLKFLHLKSFACYMEGITSFNQVEEYITFPIPKCSLHIFLAYCF